jgi:hypothetical protein
MPVAYTDLFNVALDNLTTSIGAILGISVVNDPRNANPPCAFIDAPSFTGWNYNIVKMAFPVRLITLGPGNLDAQRNLLNMMSKLLAANLGITDGRPTIAIIGGAEYPAYDVTVNMQSQTA